MRLGNALALAKKDWKRILRDPAFLFMIILFPVMLTIAFGTSFGAVGGSQVTTFNVGMVALGGNSTSSALFHDDMQATGVLKVTGYADNASAQSALSQGQLQAVILIPSGFDQTVQSFKAHPTEPAMWTNSTVAIFLDKGSAITAQVVPSIITQVIQQGVLGVKQTDQALPILVSAPSQVAVKGTTVFQSFAPGLFAFASIYMIMMVAQAYTGERESGLLSRILVTPTTSGDIAMGSVISYLVIGLIQALLVFACVYALGYTPVGGFSSLAVGFLLITVFALCNIGFGLITAAIAKSAGAATGISFVFLMPQLFLGTFVGSALSSSAQAVGRFLPAYYVTDGLTSLWTRGAAITSATVLTDLAAVSVSSVLILLIGIQVFNRFGKR
jgi:ABC-2 type transport system permease protein